MLTLDEHQWELEGECSAPGEEPITILAGEPNPNAWTDTQQITIRDGEGWISLAREDHNDVTSIAVDDDGTIVVETESQTAMDDYPTFEIVCP